MSTTRISGVLFDLAGTLLMPEDGDRWLRGGLDAVGVALGGDDVSALVVELEAAGRPACWSGWSARRVRAGRGRVDGHIDRQVAPPVIGAHARAS